MQRVQFNQTTVSTRVMPVCLSVLLAVSATVGVSIAKSPNTKLTHGAIASVKAKAAPDTKKDAPKSGAAKTDKAPEKVKDKETLKKEFDASLIGAAPVDPMAVMHDPGQFVNKKVTFTATFNRFADIALDYKKAFRDSRDYVTFFVLRPDVTDHTIPMSEMKLFFPRKKSSEVMDLDPGDKIQIIGTEFSTALDEPWIDVEHIRVVEKTEKKEKKHSPEF
jgi:hypothetical protein